MKHTTPGPWSCWNGQINGIGRNAHTYDEGLIARMPNMDSKKQQANAQLIAAAPDLLKACEMAKLDLQAVITLLENAGIHTKEEEEIYIACGETLIDILNALEKTERR